MKTIIIGAGSMGCYFAANMQDAGAEVGLYDIDGKKLEKIAENGIVIRETDGDSRRVMVPVYPSLEDAPTADLLIVLVKAYHTARAARDIAQTMTAKTMVISLQNGLGNEEELCSRIPKSKICVGITYNSGYELSPGEIQHTASGLTIVAPMLKESLQQAMEQARLFNNCRLPAGATTDIEPLRWKKLIIDSVINPLSAIHKLNNGALPKNPDIVRDMVELTVEGVTVAQKAGVPLDYGEIWAAVLDACRSSAQHRSSMLNDVERGRFTEIEAINGSIVRIGEVNGVDTPANVRTIRRVVAIQGKRDSY
ncbi:MAG: 2-dehydropantoate 2-reductase [Firmicutes bacterium]|nr:2-dehydropantoate 2-reductase [Bacillota bacterium]